MNDREKKLNEIKQKYINMENEEKEIEDSNEVKKEEEKDINNQSPNQQEEEVQDIQNEGDEQ